MAGVMKYCLIRMERVSANRMTFPMVSDFKCIGPYDTQEDMIQAMNELDITPRYLWFMSALQEYEIQGGKVHD